MEIWKTIQDYEGYEVSNMGNVRSVDRIVTAGNFTMNKRGKLLNQIHNKRNDMMQVMLFKGGKKSYKLCYVHRLVAEAFLTNPNNYPLVTHINKDNKDNRAENLRYITRSPRMNKALNLI